MTRYAAPTPQHGKKRRFDGSHVSNGTNGYALEKRQNQPVPQQANGTDPQQYKGSKTLLDEKKQRLLKGRAGLPIYSHASDIRHALQARDVLILVGETGSGKSTQIPQYMLGESWCTGCIAITQPRRVAATTLARRVAEEVGTPLGSSSPASKVGYSVRFDNSTSPSTKIKFLTEGMLLQEMLQDPYLNAYSAVVVDEVHERGVNVDLILGFIRNIVTGDLKERKGKPLKTVIMSATADTEALFKFFEAGFEKPMDIETTLHDEINPNLSSASSWSGISSSDEDVAVKPRREDRSKTTKSHQNGMTTASNLQVQSDNIVTCHIEGRQHPVEIHYLAGPTLDYYEAAAKCVFQINHREPLPGDVLVFLTGQDAVEAVEALVNEYAEGLGPEVPKLLVLPLFAALPWTEQQRVFLPTPSRVRKVILATNIAETSVTIPGVRYVVDSGLAKVKEFRSQLGLDSLLVKQISKSAAIQRKGRAGREAPGKCYRLYTEKDYLAFQQTNVPEVLRCDLASAFLTMKARGVTDILTFPFLDPPHVTASRRALMQLHRLKALNDEGRITQVGSRMARLPLLPPLARVLITAAQPDANCVLEVIDIISSLTVENVFQNLMTEERKEEAEEARRELYQRDGDHLTLMTTVQAFAAENTDRLSWSKRHFVSHRAMQNIMNVRKQLRKQCQQQKLLDRSADLEAQSVYSSELATRVLKCFLKGFAANTARLMPDGSYKTMEGNQTVTIHPASVLFGRKLEAILYNELIFTNKCYARGVSAIQMNWYEEAVIR